MDSKKITIFADVQIAKSATSISESKMGIKIQNFKIATLGIVIMATGPEQRCRDQHGK